MYQSNETHITIRLHKSEMSRHAQKRCAQRGINEKIIPLLYAFGEQTHDGLGCICYVMTQRAHNKMTQIIGRNQKIDALVGTYMVVSSDDEVVVTVGYKYS